MSVMLLTEHHFEFPILKGDCTGSSELTLQRFCMHVFLFFCHFPIRCSGSGVILIVSIPDICVLPYILTQTSTDSQEIPYSVLSSQIKKQMVAH